MGLFGSNLIEWENPNNQNVLERWKKKIRKDSTLFLRSGQAAVILESGEVQAIFEQQGQFSLTSQVESILDRLLGMRHGKVTPQSLELIFVNTSVLAMNWGTKNPIMISVPGQTECLPVRGFGNYLLQVDDIAQVISFMHPGHAAVTVQEVRERVDMVLHELLMKNIGAGFSNLAALQANAAVISDRIQQDLDMEMLKIGYTVRDFHALGFSYASSFR